jgi:hypothetical protein
MPQVVRGPLGPIGPIRNHSFLNDWALLGVERPGSRQPVEALGPGGWWPATRPTGDKDTSRLLELLMHSACGGSGGETDIAIARTGLGLRSFV